MNGTTPAMRSDTSNRPSKARILAEIKRVAAELDGATPGMRTFEGHTGIRRSVWRGVYWRDWSEAIREAGLSPNAVTPRTDEIELLRRYALLARELNHYPTEADLRLMKRRDATFPSKTTYQERFGSLQAVRTLAYEFCLAEEDLQDIVPILAAQKAAAATHTEAVGSDQVRIGSVYLIKHGSRTEYKIGKTFDPGQFDSL